MINRPFNYKDVRKGGLINLSDYFSEQIKAHTLAYINNLNQEQSLTIKPGWCTMFKIRNKVVLLVQTVLELKHIQIKNGLYLQGR